MQTRSCVSFLAALFFIVASASANNSPHWTQDVLIEPNRADALYFQILAARDESKLHELLLTDSAEAIFPAPDQKSEDSAIAVTLLRRVESGTVRVAAKWVPQARMPQVSFNLAIDTGPIPTGSLLLLARHRTDATPLQFEYHVLNPDMPHYGRALAHFGLSAEQIREGVSGVDTVCQSTRNRKPSIALQKFLSEFDRLTSLGYVPTQRRGSTGIGYTLESLLDIEENNNQSGDFLGMELKAHRVRDGDSTSSRRMNLFLKEPQWIDGLSHRSRIPKYGYVDDNGRLALYSTVTSRENAHGLSARVDREKRRVWLQFRGRPVAYWTFDILAERLQEKLRETVFVGAATRGSGASEQFHFNSVDYCRDPSVESFVGLLERREVVIEMRMHLKPEGTARNHGTAFRVMQDQIPRLYAVTVECRSK